jgi:hypothetical protein
MSHELDPVQKLEHDHHHLTRLVDDLRGGIQEVLRGDRQAAELREPLDSFMELAQEELFAHFEYEEVTLFPFLIEKMPDCRASVAELELAHDRMCGVVSRMSHMLGQGDEALTQNFDAFVVMFARFDANFVKHARDEWELLQLASSGLSEADRRTLAAAMEGH